jgi:4-hydroxybenzoyl-CoA reductase beta subunit
VRLPRFEYFEPKKLEEAVSILFNEPAAKILAGGTDLFVNMKHRVELPSVIVNIKRIGELNFIREGNGFIRIGSLTSLKRIIEFPFIVEKIPGLAMAASSVGSPHHQTMGTIGGNLCQQNRCKYFNQSQWWRSARPTCYKVGGEICFVVNKKNRCYSSYCGDLAPALLVMNAKIVLIRKESSREIPLENLFSGDGKNPLKLERREILSEIIIPKMAINGFSSYLKLANRKSIDFPVVGAAFWASMGTREYRVAFTAIERKPIRLYNTEKFLKGRDLSGKIIDEASDIASEEVTPVKTFVHSPVYKKKMMGLLVRDAMSEIMRRSGK